MLFFALIFPIWWLIIGYFIGCPFRQLIIGVLLIFAGGIIGFFIAFVCGGGAGGSSQLGDSEWSCLIPYLAIYHAILVRTIIFQLPKEW